MAKGKTNQPLCIHVLGTELYQSPEVRELIAQGHEVCQAVSEADLIIGPKAHYMDATLIKHLPIAIKAVRAKLRKQKKETKE